MSTATISERATATVKAPSKRVCCPNCETSFDLFKANKPRSIEQHRRFWGVVNAAYMHWPESHDRQFSSVNELRHFLTMKAGWREVAATIPLTGVKPDHAVMLATAAMQAGGSHCVAVAHKGALVIWQPKSIKFLSMSHLEFVALNNAVDDVLKAEIGMTGDQLLEQKEGTA